MLWIALAVAMFALPFLSAPGNYVFDTHDSLWFHPATYLARSLSLWRSTPYLGLEQHDGLIFPMGVTVWGLRSIGLPIWVVERLWHGGLLFVSVAGTVLLVDAIRGTRTAVAPFVAGLAYTLTPATFGYGLTFTPVWLPAVLLPLLLVVVIRGIERPGLAWPVAFGLVTFCMGGGNGAPQVFVVLTALLLLSWLVFVERRVPVRRGLRFAGWSMLFFLGMNAYWLFLLSSPEVTNALKFTEQPTTINVASSASETIRGLGYWQFYGGDQVGPWVPAVQHSLSGPLLVVASFAVPIGAVASAWLVRWRLRLFFTLLAILAAFVAVGLYPVRSPSPFGRLLELAYNHVPGAGGLRTSYKAVAEMSLGLALLFGIGAEAAGRRTWSWAAAAFADGRTRLVRFGFVALVSLVVAANAYPLLTGGLYNPERSMSSLPGYWHQALSTLDRRDTTFRAFFVPSTSWTTAESTWGALKEHVDATDPEVNAVDPVRLPVEQRYGTNLVAAVEAPYLDGASPQGTAQLMRYLGVRDVVLQNDIDWRSSLSASPAEFGALRGDSDLAPSLAFGAPGEGIAAPPSGGGVGSIRPVQLLTVRGAVPMIRAEPATPVLLSGDGFGMAEAARDGLLAGGPPVLYTGSLAPASLGAVLRQTHPQVIVTDSNRRRVWFFTRPRAPRTNTLPAGATVAGRPTGFLLFGDRMATQSVAEYPGLRSITSSGYGSPFGTDPQFRPANAFDGDPTTWWFVRSVAHPEGAWIQADLRTPAFLSSVSVDQPTLTRLRTIRRYRLTFSDGSSVTAAAAPGRRTIIRFPGRFTSSVRITLTSVAIGHAGGGLSGAAIADIGIRGVDTVERVRVPDDLFRTADSLPAGGLELARLPFAYLFERAGNSYPGAPPEEVAISRRFDVAGTRRFDLAGTVRLNALASDAVIDRILFGRRSVTATSSSRLLGSPALRASAALDGNPSTEWVPSGTVGQWMDAHFPAHVIDHLSLVTDTDRGRITRVRAVFSDGSSVVGSPADPAAGVIDLRFAPRTTSGVAIFVERVFAPLGQPRTVGIRELRIPGVDPIRGDPNQVPPCSYSSMEMDGRTVPVRPDGTVGDLLAGREVAVHTCQGFPVTLVPGSHVLWAGGALQPDDLSLRTGGEVAPMSPPAPSVVATTGAGGSFRVRVTNARGPYYLVLGQNYDPEWSASIGGRDLGAPILLDGYSVGWRIAVPGSYVVSVTYRKQRLYDVALIATALFLAVGITVVATAGIRRRRATRRRPPRPGPVGGAGAARGPVASG